ncbi:MAG: tetratricopeptide repeat protein [Armatimonadetes bacterium]|nr:tetratricopeptide repeat protein [Armatimonadota bacterium]
MIRPRWLTAILLALPVVVSHAWGASARAERLALLWQRAEAQLSLEKSLAALQTARRAVRLAPRSADAWALMSLVTFETATDLDFTTMDIADTANHAARLGNSSKVWLVIGLCNCFCGPETEQGLHCLRHSLQLNPTYARAHAMLGEGLWDAGRTEEALAALREAIRLAPRESRWHLSLSRRLGELNRLDEALTANDLAVRWAATNLQLSYAHRERAWLRAYQGRWTEAVEEARLGCALLPDDLEATIRAAAAAARNCPTPAVDNWRLMRAEATFGAILALYGDYARADRALAEAWHDWEGSFASPARAYVLAQLDRPDEAARHLPFQESWREYPQSLRQLVFLAKAYQAVGDAPRARDACDVGLRRWPAHPLCTQLRALRAELPASR